MLEHIDEALEALFRAAVPLAARDIDVSFDAPEREWSAKLTRPTVNLFLSGIWRSADRARAGLEQVERDGQQIRRPPLPRVELRYVVTVWTADQGDERSLLGGLLRAALAHDSIPTGFLPDAIADLPTPKLAMARPDADRLDSVPVYDGQMKAAIHVAVIAAVEVGAGTPVGPPVTSLETQLSDMDHGHAPEPDAARRIAGEVLDPAAIGATVVSPRGVCTVNETGRFVIRAATGDELIVESDPPHRVEVPAVGGVRVG